MKKSVILNEMQVKRLQETGTVAVVELVKPQPDGIRESPFVKSGIETIHGYEIKLPYTKGQQVYVRESCWYNEVTDSFYYKAVEYCKEEMDTAIAFGLGWKSPAIMFEEAARLFPIVASVEVVRVKDVGTEQQYKLGFRCGSCDALGCGECSNTMDYSYEIYIINRFGLSAWDNNAFIFITTFKIEK